MYIKWQLICLPEDIVVSPTNCWPMSNLYVVRISLPHLNFYEHHLSKLVNWLYISTSDVFSCHAIKFQFIFLLPMWNNTCRKSRKGKLSKQDFGISLAKWIQESIGILFCKKSEKNLGVFATLNYSELKQNAKVNLCI